MAFASPSASSRAILSVRDTATTANTLTYNFTIPQDCDEIVAKIWLASTWSSTGTATIRVQTTEDGGTTWRDVSETGVGAITDPTSITNDNAHFIPISCACNGMNKGVSNYVGSVANSSLILATVNCSVNGTVSALPMMGTLGRVQIVKTATVSAGGINVDVFAPTTQLR